MGCHFLLQGIFLTQGSNLGLLHCRQIRYQLSHQGHPNAKLGAIQLNWMRRTWGRRDQSRGPGRRRQRQASYGRERPARRGLLPLGHWFKSSQAWPDRKSLQLRVRLPDGRKTSFCLQAAASVHLTLGAQRPRTLWRRSRSPATAARISAPSAWEA